MKFGVGDLVSANPARPAQIVALVTRVHGPLSWQSRTLSFVMTEDGRFSGEFSYVIRGPTLAM